MTKEELIKIYRENVTSQILTDKNYNAVGFYVVSMMPDGNHRLNSICDKPADSDSVITWDHTFNGKMHLYSFYCPSTWITYPYGFIGCEYLEGDTEIPETMMDEYSGIGSAGLCDWFSYDND